MAVAALLAAALAAAVSRGSVAGGPGVGAAGGDAFLLQPFSAGFLAEYWLHFELTSVLLSRPWSRRSPSSKGGRRKDG